jgi:anti-sigma B factor antagonist
MEITVTRHGHLVVAAGLPKHFDYTVCPEILRILTPHLDPAPPALILDLSGVEFMDSSAIGSLITIRNRLLPAGGVLALCGLGETVAKVLRITDLGKVFALHADLETALAAHSA